MVWGQRARAPTYAPRRLACRKSRPRGFPGSERLGEAVSSSLIVEGRNVIVTEVVERAVAERPGHGTIESIIEWLTGGARQIGSFARTIDELSWRLVAAGMPVLRVSLRGGTLHPQFLGAVYVWWRTSAQTQEIMITHEVADLIPPAENPVVRVWNGETLRRRLEGPETRFDFSILHDLKASGATASARTASKAHSLSCGIRIASAPP